MLAIFFLVLEVKTVIYRLDLKYPISNSSVVAGCTFAISQGLLSALKVNMHIEYTYRQRIL